MGEHVHDAAELIDRLGRAIALAGGPVLVEVEDDYTFYDVVVDPVRYTPNGEAVVTLGRGHRLRED